MHNYACLLIANWEIRMYFADESFLFEKQNTDYKY